MGIDVGTATTKIIISRLTFADLAGGAGPPRLRLVSREILHRSRLYETPVDGDRLDGPRLLACLDEVLAGAGVDRGALGSGGVIITGEAARSENARQMVNLLADRAGAFVVATAGPHLEAVLAGWGSGAAARSEVTGTTVAAIDIGGGTANIALFRQGRLLQTACLNLGGRAIRFDPATGRIERVTAAAQAVLAAAGRPRLQVGQVGTGPLLHQAAAAMAGVVAGALAGEGAPPGLYDGPPLAGGPPVDEVLLSGGVGSYVGRDRLSASEAALGDIGPALGRALGPALRARGYRLLRPAETTYATVIGVGVHSLTLSGGSICVTDPALLPLRNVPVIRPPAGLALAGWPDSLRAQAARHPPDAPLAVALGPLPDLSWAGLTRVAQAIRQGLPDHRGRANPLVLLTEQDLAAALGVLLQAAGAPLLIALDEVQAGDGSYVDIGEPLYGGAAVPVVVKTLIFGAGGEGSPCG